MGRLGEDATGTPQEDPPMTDRELDALVAEKVMGWKEEFDGLNMRWTLDGERWAGDSGYVNGWSPSTRISHAWQVVEKMLPAIGHIYPAVDLETGELLHWCAVVETGDTSRQGVTADTAPRAICLAALKAVGEATDE